MPHAPIPALLLLGLLAATYSEPLCADDAVEQGRQSLRGQVEYPWYDAENDRLRRIDVPQRSEEEVEVPEDLPNEPTASASGDSALGGFFQVIFWIFIVLLFAAIIGALIWAFLRADRHQTDSEATQVVQSSHEVDRIENLPFKIRSPQADLLAEAERHYAEGNYREAVIYLYSYKLVELDKHHRIRLAKGKTNRQYLREVRSDQRLAGLLESTMVAFEDVFFGHHDLSRRRFEECWNSVGQFRGLVGQGAVA